MKLIDIWLFVGLILPFLAFVFEVIEEIAEEKERSKEKEQNFKVRQS